MKISATNRIVQKIMDINEQKGISAVFNDATSTYINHNTTMLSDEEKTRYEASRLKRYIKEKGGKDISTDEAILYLMLQGLIINYFDDREGLYLWQALIDNSRVFYPSDFDNNEYIKNIIFDNEQIGDFVLEYQEYQPWELAMYDIPTYNKTGYIEIPRICVFPERFKYPSISQESIKSTWMSVTPNEIFTMKKAIEKAKGRVLTLGCGMGYFAYMASLKDEVESVVVVEKEQNVIDLFNCVILPQFSQSKKISIIKADAIDFLKNLQDGEFDFCFADIWIGVNDTEPYMAVKEIGREFKKMNIMYWIEDSFGMVFSDYAFMEIVDTISEKGASSHSLYGLGLTEDQNRNRNYIHRLLEDEEISKVEHIDYYLNPKNLLALMDKTSIEYKSIH